VACVAITWIGLGMIPGTASGDDDPREPRSLPRHSVTLALGGHSSRLAGMSEGGFDTSLEYALGHQRWQVFAEGTVSSTTLGPHAMDLGGMRLRAGLGARWIVRSFELEDLAAIEMTLEAFSGIQQFRWSGGGVLARGDLGFGPGMQVRVFRRGAIVRFATRVSFADSKPGFSASMGVSW
jgi:hypothetical protein